MRNRTLGTTFCLFLRPCPPAGTGFSGLRPEIEKHRKNIVSASPRKQEKLAAKLQNGQNPIFEPIFCLIFSYFLGEAETNIYSIFPTSGRRPENPVPAGGQGRKPVS